MIDRKHKIRINKLLDKVPAVVLIGPRQVGKTTLAFEIAESTNAVYLDLERPSDLAKIADVEQFCALNADKLIVFDEVQRVAELFAPLRSIIDDRKRQGRNNKQFLLLGSASIDLLKQSSESLAGRVAYCELTMLDITEVGKDNLYQLWSRGGFPESFLSQTDEDSFNWRQNFVRTYLERDIPQLGPRIPVESLRRFWIMLAHNQGQAFNAAAFARSLDVSGVTTARYLDLMVDLLLVRRLQPWTSNLGRRLIKAPKTYIRDSGVCHSLLSIKSLDDLLAHPVVGGSWEGFVIENILANLPSSTSFGYYRTKAGAEIDLVIEFAFNDTWAIEIKRNTSPTVSKGFYNAIDDIKPRRSIVVHAGDESFPLPNGVEAMTLVDLLQAINTD